MKRVETKPVTSYERDGCGYLLGRTTDEVAAGVTLASKITTLRIPWEPFEIQEDGGVFIEFHFHGPEDEGRRDCFRYWAHSPHVMKQSLKHRSFDDDEIDQFMSTHLYRATPFGAGIARPEETKAR
jgi:hypothetical protein